MALVLDRSRSCIDCEACVTECPFDAIFPEDEVLSAYVASAGQIQSMPLGNSGFDPDYEDESERGEPVRLKTTRVLEEGQVIDLTGDIQANYAYFESGPGYAPVET